MTEQFKRGDFVVFNNQFGFPNMQKELEDYYANYGISVGDIGKVSRRNTNGWIRIKFNDTIVSMRKHDLIKYNDFKKKYYSYVKQKNLGNSFFVWKVFLLSCFFSI